MALLTFIVRETPDAKLVKVGARLTLEEAAQLLELNAHELYGHAYLVESVTHCGFTIRVLHDHEAGVDETWTAS